MTTPTPAPLPAQPASASAGTVFWAILPSRDTLFVTGRDAVRFIDNFQTAKVATLAPQTGSEAFFTDGRGQVIVLANIFRPGSVEDSGNVDGLWIDLPTGMAGRLRDHLEHYHIREDVEFRDASADRAGLLIGGPGAAAWLAAGAGAGPRLSITPPPERLGHHPARLGGIPVYVVHDDWFGSGCFHVITAAADRPRLIAWLTAQGLPEVEAARLEEWRILAANPDPVDIPDKTLPQELGRDARAISFTKGCYLGQETVARLDALGHVNRRLVTLAIDGSPPATPAAVMQTSSSIPGGGVPVGTITSACHSARLGCTAGLALVQVKALTAAAGTTAPDAGPPFSVEGRGARVVEPAREELA
jgi:folate-binding protein YgfZ